MIGIGLAFILVGIVFLFIIPWVGIPVGIIGVILAVLYLAGVGRRAHRGGQPTQPGPSLESLAMRFRRAPATRRPPRRLRRVPSGARFRLRASCDASAARSWPRGKSGCATSAA